MRRKNRLQEQILGAKRFLAISLGHRPAPSRGRDDSSSATNGWSRPPSGIRFDPRDHLVKIQNRVGAKLGGLGSQALEQLVSHEARPAAISDSVLRDSLAKRVDLPQALGQRIEVASSLGMRTEIET